MISWPKGKYPLIIYTLIAILEVSSQREFRGAGLVLCNGVVFLKNQGVPVRSRHAYDLHVVVRTRACGTRPVGCLGCGNSN